MRGYLGDFPINGKVFFLWDTNAQDGASITRSTDGTLKIFKGSTTHATWATERSSLAGVVQTEDFDATGIHAVSIDLADNTDAGFYAAGNEYQVAIVGAVIDTKTVNQTIAHFSIERANGALAQLKAVISGGRVLSDVKAVDGQTAEATTLQKSLSVVYRGSVTGAATTTTLIDSGLTQADADFWKGRIVIFTSGALKFQATDILSFAPASDQLTFTAVTQSPSGGDTYVIV